MRQIPPKTTALSSKKGRSLEYKDAGSGMTAQQPTSAPTAVPPELNGLIQFLARLMAEEFLKEQGYNV